VVTDDRDMRTRLLDAAARLLAQEGPAALTTRRVAREAGTSSMAVYTQFGSMPQLVREIVREGFRRLADHLERAPAGEDAVADLGALAVAYREHAVESPQIYGVMFGTASLGGYSLTTQDMVDGRYTLDRLSAATTRAIDQGRLSGDAALIANRFWAATHGYVTLELAGYYDVSAGALEAVLVPMLVALAVGHGDDPELAERSARAVAVARAIRPVGV
jgi:AcrR family transcriptional regulator